MRSSILHLVLGPWGSGKSTVAARVVGRLPGCVVFDWDEIIPALSLVAGKDVFVAASTWDGLHATWFAIIRAILAGGHDVVLCCSVEPDAIPADVVPSTRIRAAFLDCPDEVLRARLLARAESEDGIRDELVQAAAFRTAGYTRVPAGDRDPDEIARDLAAWVHAAEDDAQGHD